MMDIYIKVDGRLGEIGRRGWCWFGDQGPVETRCVRHWFVDFGDGDGYCFSSHLLERGYLKNGTRAIDTSIKFYSRPKISIQELSRYSTRYSTRYSRSTP